MRIMFGPWEPDLPEHQQNGVQIADNVYAGPNGYRPINSFSGFTEALTEDFQGGATFVAPDGTVQLLFGSSTDLYRYNSTLSWTSMLGSLVAGRWHFTQFGNTAVGTYGGAPVGIDLGNGTAAALAGGPPSAFFCATVRDFVVLGNIGSFANRVQWSGFNDATSWTPGTNQSDFQDMLTGGAVTGLAGGEYGLVFQRARITRMTYVGEPIIWQFDEISANIGCIAAGSIAQAGRQVFFLSERGFMVTDGNDVVPIGAEKVDREFLDAYSREDLSLMTATVDPKNHLVVFCMPGKMWIYNWQLGRWTTSTQDIVAVLEGFTAGVSLEDLDALYASNIDTMDVSLDDAKFRGGSPLLLCVDRNNVAGVLEGERLEATIELPKVEFFPGRTTRLTQARVLTDATDDVAVHFSSAKRLGDAFTETRYGVQQDDGRLDCRVQGRYIKTKVTISAGASWSYLQGIEYPKIFPGGAR